MTAHSDNRNEPEMIATLLTLAAMLLFVLLPALIPGAVHVVYLVRNRQPIGRLAAAAA
jgi:hypothetical protein